MKTFYSMNDARSYVRSLGRKRFNMYFNVYGWDTYLTTEPTVATPSGEAKGFPRIVQVRV